MSKTAIHYTGTDTEHIDRRFSGQFLYLDPDGRKFKLESEELTVTEEADAATATASVGLPDPGTEAALLLVRAVMEAMELHYDYDLVAKDGA